MTATEASTATATEADKPDVTDVGMCHVTPLSGGRMFRWGSKTHVMGILNATPDSFSDGGMLIGSCISVPADLTAAVSVARGMVRDGADILDIGGQSTRPGAERVPEQQEAGRVVPLIRCAVLQEQVASGSGVRKE